MTLATSPLERATSIQNLAADPGLSAWVSASAGSGKTKVLIDRFVRLLLAGTLPQKILCLTYTQAAAAEMTARVTERLSHWAVCEEEKLEAELSSLTLETQEQPLKKLKDTARTLFAAVLDCPGGLRIKTFHAFAQEVLARFPLEAGVVPHFTVLDDGTAQQLREMALVGLLSNRSPEIELAWGSLVSRFDGERLQNLLKQLLHDQQKFNQALVRYDGLNGLCAALYQAQQQDPTLSIDQYKQQACADHILPLAALQKMAVILQAEGKVEAGEKLQGWLALSPADRAAQFFHYQSLFLTDKNVPRKRILKSASEKANPDLTDSLVQEAQRVEQVVAAAQTIQRLQLTTALLTLGGAYHAAYAGRKNQMAALDFDDVMNRTASLLEQDALAPWVLWKLDGGIDHIMIDEAQDTSPTQWRIIKALTAEFFAGQGASHRQRTLFVVGDEKQSIYSFQHADPSQFHTMRDYFAAQIKAAQQRFELLHLNVSFRSVPLVLEKIDAVFAHPTLQDGVSAEPVLHASSRQDATGHIVFWPPVHPAVGTEKSEQWQVPDDYEFSTTPAAQLADLCAVQIEGWIKNQRLVAVRHGKIEIMRPVQAGDIMILVRRRNALVPALVRALKLRNIAVSGVDRLVLRDALCVQDMLALIQFVLLPEDDLNCACVLRGPLLGCDEATLERLCSKRITSLWNALQTDSASHDVVLWLQALCASAASSTCYDFLAQILLRSCPTARSGKMALVARLGRDALDPLDELLNRAQQFGAQQPDSLQQFVQQMRQDEQQIKRTLEQGAGEVRIMTVHAAKGLQSPIVLVPDSCSAPRSNELNDLQWDKVTSLPYYIGGGEKTRDDFAAQLHQTAHHEQLQEYHRLLYVALTRAESELHIFGYHGRKKAATSWHHLMQQALVPEAAEADNLIQPPAHPLAVWGGDNQTMPQPGGAVSAPQTSPTIPLPAWALRAAMPEFFIRPLSPSQLGADENVPSPVHLQAQQGLQRGRLLHQLLQYLPNLPTSARQGAAENFLCQYEQDHERRMSLCAEVLRILEHPAYEPLFAVTSRAEVPLMGVVEHKGESVLMSGQLDRLAVTDHEVLVVDYKTNRPPPTQQDKIPQAYHQQMAAYRGILQQIYPDKTVRCFLLWTYNATMMELSADDRHHGLLAPLSA
jgi:ATP-dependent helicase/nuclease subunit A